MLKERRLLWVALLVVGVSSQFGGLYGAQIETTTRAHSENDLRKALNRRVDGHSQLGRRRCQTDQHDPDQHFRNVEVLGDSDRPVDEPVRSFRQDCEADDEEGEGGW